MNKQTFLSRVQVCMLMALMALFSTSLPKTARAQVSSSVGQNATASTPISTATSTPTTHGVAVSNKPTDTTGNLGATNIKSVDILSTTSTQTQTETQAQRNQNQPGNAAPTWREVAAGKTEYSSLPYPESGVLIQANNAGQKWRALRNGPITRYGGWGLLLVVLALAAFYFYKGSIKLSHPRVGRVIERFTSVERITHWTMALSFVTLGLTGITMLFGKYVILPAFGHTLYGWLAYACKNIHNFVGPVFAVSIVVFFVIFIKDNLPAAADIKWLLKGGGLLGGGHVPSGRFNFGEKIWFWSSVVFFGLIVSATGFVLDQLVPSFMGLEYTRALMQQASVFHIVAALIVFAMSFGHIYLGTVGMEGAYEGMRTGYVDEAWAQEHHEHWFDDVKSGKIPAARSVEAKARLSEWAAKPTQS